MTGVQTCALPIYLALVAVLKEIGAARDATVAQVAVAWVMAQGERQRATIIPLVGARSRRQLTESLGAAGLTLTSEDLSRIEASIPSGAASGSRYPEDQMAMLDSEH